ncbi:hypothetical protein CMV_021744 [Castanea mollissima]|uniref:Uncharacterized protein n=1 Tax=Castanea mollissima TaxID=60419 RepID=A0A8J4QF64_9ROSI|nr:hypothetical protein CMV_021744 [Castanea mollissima]
MDLNLDVLPRVPLKLKFGSASQRSVDLNFGCASQRFDGFEFGRASQRYLCLSVTPHRAPPKFQFLR